MVTLEELGQKVDELGSTFRDAHEKGDYKTAMNSLANVGNYLVQLRRAEETDAVKKVEAAAKQVFTTAFSGIKEAFSAALVGEKYQASAEQVTLCLNLLALLQQEAFQAATDIKEGVVDLLAMAVGKYQDLEPTFTTALKKRQFNPCLVITSAVLNLLANIGNFALPALNPLKEPLEALLTRILVALLDLNERFQWGIEKRDYQLCIEIMTLTVVLAVNLIHNDPKDLFNEHKDMTLSFIDTMETEFVALKEEFAALQEKEQFRESAMIAQVYAVLLENLNKNDRYNDFMPLRERIKGLLEDVFPKVAQTEAQFTAALKAKEYKQAAEIVFGLLNVASAVGDENMVGKYKALQDQLEASLHDTVADGEARVKLQLLDEEFQNKFADGAYEDCLALVPELVTYAAALGDSARVQEYQQLKAQIEKSMYEQEEFAVDQEEKRAAIERLKKQAYRLEAKGKFEEAKAKYQEIRAIGQEIEDPLVVQFADRKIAQIDEWLQLIADFDLSKWTIHPFKIINRRRFDYRELFPTREAGEAKKEEMMAAGMDKDEAHVVGIIRKRFAGKGPFNDKGEVYALYVRPGVQV